MGVPSVEARRLFSSSEQRRLRSAERLVDISNERCRSSEKPRPDAVRDGAPSEPVDESRSVVSVIR